MCSDISIFRAIIRSGTRLTMFITEFGRLRQSSFSPKGMHLFREYILYAISGGIERLKRRIEMSAVMI